MAVSLYAMYLGMEGVYPTKKEPFEADSRGKGQRTLALFVAIFRSKNSTSIVGKGSEVELQQALADMVANLRK